MRVKIALSILLVLLSFMGCKRNTGWKAQSSPTVSSSVSSSSGEEKPIRDDRPTSVGVGSFLHDLFGTSLPADTDRYLLPVTEEEKQFKLDDYIHYADAYGDTMYFIRLDDPNVYAFDFMAGEERVFAADAVKDPAAICTDADGIYVADVGAKEVVYFTFDGARAGSVALPEEPKANLDGPEGYAWMLEKYYPSVRHYDGLLLLAARDAIWTIADGETEWQRAEYPFVNGEFVDAAAILSRNRIAVYTTRCLIRVPVLNRVTEMNRKGEEQKLLYDQSVQAMSANNGCLYITTGRNGTVRLFEIGTGQVVFLQNLDTKPNAVVNFAVSGGAVFIEWAGKKVDLIPGTENANMVTLYTPESARAQAEQITDAVSSAPVRYVSLDDSVYFDKLSASILSGKADFDIALVTGTEEEVSTLLRAVLENGQFADLSGNADLNAHLDEAFPGVKDFITVDGKLAFLPLELDEYWYGFTELAQECGVPLPPSNWNPDDLDAYAEKLAQSGERYTLFTEPGWQKANVVMSAALSAAQANMDSSDPGGHKAEEALKELFTRLAAYREAGVFSGPHAMFGAAGTRMDFIVKGTENYLLALPPAMGKHPAQVVSFLFVNLKSPRIEAALSLLADLTNGENRYNAAIYPTPLFPDVTSYYKYEIYDAEKDEWFDTPRKMPAFRGEYLDFAMRLEQLFETYYLHSEPAHITPTERAMNAVSDFCTGKMTGEDCARILYEEFVYRIKG